MLVACRAYAYDSTTKHRYLWANYEQFAGKSDANDWYNELFSSKISPYGYKGYLCFLDENHRYAEIIKLMPSVEGKFAQDSTIQRIFFDALVNTQQHKKAENLIIQLSQSFKTDPDITLRAAQAYLGRKEAKNALLTIRDFLNNTPRRPNNFIFYFLESHIHVQLDNLPQALESIGKCLEMHPHFEKGWLVSAVLHEKDGKITEAISAYKTFLDLAGSNRQIEQQIFALTMKQKAIKDNKLQLLSPTISLDNALILFKQQRYEQALAYINRCIEKQPQNNECKLLKIQILVKLEDYKNLATTISAWIGSDKENSMWPKTVYLLTHDGMAPSDVLALFSAILTQRPDNLWSHLYATDLCLRLGHNVAAITHLNNALALSSDNAFKAIIAYQCALLHYEEGNHELMHTTLEQAHNFNNDCPHINNALAYYWATKGKNTTKALSFIQKSLQHDSSNPHFLDTHALILYKEKKYHEAQQILDQLATTNNSTMLLHLAKVHYKLNNKEIADTFTKKAESFVRNNQEKKALHKMQLLLAQV